MSKLSRREATTLAIGCVGALAATSHLFAQEKGIGDFPKLSATGDWPWWRGPNRDGHAAQGDYPVRFAPGDAKWKTPVPGRGHSSPTVVGDRVFLTTADEGKKVHSVLAFNRADGKSLWSVDVNKGGFPAKNHDKNTEATPTIACDGERLFATFYHHDSVALVALDLDGQKLWEKKAGAFRPTKFEYGYAPSPLLYRDSVIIAAEYDGKSFLAAFKRADGKQKWRAERPNNITFSSPVTTAINGKDQLLLSGAELVAAYSPETGKPLWKTPGTTNATCGTMVWDGDIVFASGGFPKAETLAVKVGAKPEVLWRNNQKCYEQSMIVVDGHLYGLTDAGVLYCWEGATGKEKWAQRLRGPISASPVYAGGHIYWANESGSLFVFKPNPDKFDPVVENKIGGDSFPSPAACGGEIFLRVGEGSRQEMLYCFGV